MTWTPSPTALSEMVDDSGECFAALVSRLLRTCTMRSRSAMTQGRSRARSRSMSCLPPPLRKPLHASPTRRATSVGSEETAKGARLDAGHVQQVADQHVHPDGPASR